MEISSGVKLRVPSRRLHLKHGHQKYAYIYYLLHISIDMRVQIYHYYYYSTGVCVGGDYIHHDYILLYKWCTCIHYNCVIYIYGYDIRERWFLQDYTKNSISSFKSSHPHFSYPLLHSLLFVFILQEQVQKTSFIQYKCKSCDSNFLCLYISFFQWQKKRKIFQVYHFKCYGTGVVSLRTCKGSKRTRAHCFSIVLQRLACKSRICYINSAETLIVVVVFIIIWYGMPSGSWMFNIGITRQLSCLILNIWIHLCGRHPRMERYYNVLYMKKCRIQMGRTFHSTSFVCPREICQKIVLSLLKKPNDLLNEIVIFPLLSNGTNNFCIGAEQVSWFFCIEIYIELRIETYIWWHSMGCLNIFELCFRDNDIFVCRSIMCIIRYDINYCVKHHKNHKIDIHWQ